MKSVRRSFVLSDKTFYRMKAICAKHNVQLTHLIEFLVAEHLSGVEHELAKVANVKHQAVGQIEGLTQKLNNLKKRLEA